MKQRHQVRTALGISAVLLVVGVLLTGGSCDDGGNPVEPEQPEDYVFYYRDQATGTVYGYHLVTERIDSFTVPYAERFGMCVSAEGKRLYVIGQDATGVVDIETRTLLEELPHGEYFQGSRLHFSGDGRYVASQGAGVRIFTYPDHTLVFEDTTDARGGCFSADGERFYCSLRSTSQVRVVEIATQEVTTHAQVFSPPLTHMMVLHDESKWLLYHQVEYSPAGAVSLYDPYGDTILFREWLLPASGMFAVTPDDRWGFYCNPGTPMVDDPPAPCEFRLLDLATNRLDRLISTVGVADGINPDCVPVGWLYVTPDGRWLVAASEWGDSFLVLDIQQMKIVRYVELAGFWSNVFTGQAGM